MLRREQSNQWNRRYQIRFTRGPCPPVLILQQLYMQAIFSSFWDAQHLFIIEGKVNLRKWVSFLPPPPLCLYLAMGFRESRERYSSLLAVRRYICTGYVTHAHLFPTRNLMAKPEYICIPLISHLRRHTHPRMLHILRSIEYILRPFDGDML